MKCDVSESMEVLRRTPGVLSCLLSGLGRCWTSSNYGENTFSPFDVVGHLIHAEQTNWMTRLNMILTEGDAATFPAFDRFAMYELSKGKSMTDLLDSFKKLRAQNLEELRKLDLTQEHLEMRGTHPDLGGVNLGQLLASWVVHDLTHLTQISRAMAFQYKDEVGPWRQYFSILPKE